MSDIENEKEGELIETVAIPWETSVSDLDFVEDVLANGDTSTSEIPAELGETPSGEFVSQDQLISVIESLLFSTDKPVSVATIKIIFKGSNVRSKDILFSLEQLASDYAAPARGVTLEEVNGGYQLRTKSDNGEFLRRLAKVRPFRLSGPALEAMSIVAYKQPITKNEIDEIRGVESGHLLRALMERGLVYFAGKSEGPGKPMTYGSTRKFLEIFGLRNIRELPTLTEIDELLPDGIGEVEERETLSDITESMAQGVSTNYSEGEVELERINQQLKEVDTTSEFFEQEKERERQARDHERAQEIRERMVLDVAVDAKDSRWLAKYDAKLLEPKVVVEVTEFSAQLETLTEDAAQSAARSSLEESTSEIDDEEEELNSKMDWDEDSEHEL